MSLLDRYFKSVVYFDVVILALSMFLTYRYLDFNLFQLENVREVLSDLSNTGMTSVGFILTLLTVLITFKSTVIPSEKSKDLSTFELFFSSPLYFESLRQIKMSLIELFIASILGYIIKLGFYDTLNVSLLGAVMVLEILIVTLLRCTFILSKIIEFQKN